MAIREILLHIDTEGETAAGRMRSGFALSLARQLDAHVTALAFALDPYVPAMALAEMPVAIIDEQRTHIEKLARAAADAFSAEAERIGVSHSVHIATCAQAQALRVLSARGRVADLVVTGQRSPQDELPIREILIETALFETGSPSVIVPYIGPAEARLDRLAIAWDGRREVARAVHDAMPLLKLASSVEIVTIGKVGAAKGETHGADLQEALARHDVMAELRHIDGAASDVANILLSHAADRSIDMMVMGGYGHSRLREMMLGGATRGILESMTVPVLMSH